MAVNELKCTHFSRSARRRKESVQPASSSHERSWRGLAKSRLDAMLPAVLFFCRVFLFFLFLSSFPFNIFFFLGARRIYTYQTYAYIVSPERPLRATVGSLWAVGV